MGNNILQDLITNSSHDSHPSLSNTSQSPPALPPNNQTPTLDEFIRALCIMTALLVPNPNASYTNAGYTNAVDNTSQQPS